MLLKIDGGASLRLNAISKLVMTLRRMELFTRKIETEHVIDDNDIYIKMEVSKWDITGKQIMQRKRIKAE